MNFKNRVAMVTGAAQGIGKATALVLAQYGADIAVSDVKEQKIKQTADEINLLGRQSLGLRIDVSVKSDIVRGVDKVLEKFGRIDILVNAA
ncbi:MAG: SDR family NAD(P)-dependent oxidoreductase [Deltaproteobacteria bacterium]|jgi:NAD(P)-dependent dehydrogenase (short-subunit alcohol dehydrogenase family)|nr:SDR family NAD(P)-dependent oxidoreductase [Deltaproteobacteria bacterium]